jgi:hypothetical protein
VTAGPLKVQSYPCASCIQLICCVFLNVIPSATRKLCCMNSYLCNHAVKSRTQTIPRHGNTRYREGSGIETSHFFCLFSGTAQVATGWVTVWSKFEPGATAAFSDQAHPALFQIVCEVTSPTLQLAVFLPLRHTFS